ncbi:hypothetical protein [Taibaiella helva]|uniref:hypothetical protein n=1 Tax=Taibaiella helva TaxID=2301235 RepID=UPI0013001CF2|nr:hypothetical protein [Taibaiella helva]
MKNKWVICCLCAIGILISPSCKKNYTCTCEVNDQKYIYDYSSQLKSEAEGACNAQDAAAKRADTEGQCRLTKD